jgi:hypothetical protein
VKGGGGEKGGEQVGGEKGGEQGEGARRARRRSEERKESENREKKEDNCFLQTYDVRIFSGKIFQKLFLLNNNKSTKGEGSEENGKGESRKKGRGRK